MGRTRTSGITVDAEGNRIVRKQVDGETIFARLGAVRQEVAEKWLAERVQRITLAKQRGTRPKVSFREAAVRYLTENSQKLASIEAVAFHVELLDGWIGHLALDQV